MDKAIRRLDIKINGLVAQAKKLHKASKEYKRLGKEVTELRLFKICVQKQDAEQLCRQHEKLQAQNASYIRSVREAKRLYPKGVVEKVLKDIRYGYEPSRVRRQINQLNRLVAYY